MRIAFVKSLYEVMAKYEDSYLLTGDLGFMAFEPISEKYGKRFVNVGLCEANMIGLASGLSRAGKLPFCYSMVPFITMRCLEQIRVHLSMGGQGIVLIGVGAGYGYGKQGSSHHAIEDIGIMNSLPGITIYSPCDNYEVRESIADAARRRKPAYIRLGKTEDFECLENINGFCPGRFRQLVQGEDGAIVVTGTAVKKALEAARRLAIEGVSVSVYSVPTINPIDDQQILDLAAKYCFVVSVELNVAAGGLASILARLLLELPPVTPSFSSVCIEPQHAKLVGSMEELEDMHGVSTDSIYAAVRSQLAKGQPMRRLRVAE